MIAFLPGVCKLQTRRMQWNWSLHRTLIEIHVEPLRSEHYTDRLYSCPASAISKPEKRNKTGRLIEFRYSFWTSTTWFTFNTSISIHACLHVSSVMNSTGTIMGSDSTITVNGIPITHVFEIIISPGGSPRWICRRVCLCRSQRTATATHPQNPPACHSRPQRQPTSFQTF